MMQFLVSLTWSPPRAGGKLKLPAYDPSRFGASGDHGLEPIMDLPLEERIAALYGNGHV